MLQIRLRSRVHPDEVALKVGKIVTERDYNLLLTGPAKVYKPDGSPLCCYCPEAIPGELAEAAYPILTTIREVSDNRGQASGAERVKVGKTSRSYPVMSSIVGYIEPLSGRLPHCRLTAWTGRNTEGFRELYPYFEQVARLFKEHVPDRYAVQAARASETRPEWIIPGTPYTTVTINNTYPTGVHKDDGDLPEGFSCLSVLRRGDYRGGTLVFPEWRVAVDMQDRDVIFMDAHEWHGNTMIEKRSEDAERISSVFYYRTKMQACESPEAEIQKAQQRGKI